MAIGIFTLRQQLRGLLSKNWTGTVKTPYVEYLVVGGGGGGGGANSTLGGGGGGGGVLTGLMPVVAGATNNVTVGGGGAAGTGNVAGSQGVNSVLNSVIAVGGGNGGNQGSSGVSNPGGTGGSGGGSGLFNTVISQGIFGQGNSGGAGYAGSANTSSGGGGAGTVGFGPTTSVGGNGGAGIASAISGTVAVYGGGGGGAGYSPSSTTAGTGGVGGGGAGSNNGAATAGQANTGGGGGGAGAASSVSGGAGGSGIVIVSYPDVYAPLTTGGATSPTVSTSGSGSISFNGSTQFATYSDAAALQMGSGDFTIEFWIYFNSIASYQTPFDKGYISAGGLLIQTGNGNGRMIVYAAGSAVITETGTGSTGAWIHYALVRSGTALTLYRDGTASGSTTNSTNYNNTSPLGIGGAAAGTGIVNGYISNCRVVKNVAVYTGAFASYVPTSPLKATQSAGPSGSNIAAITGTSTSLLLNSVSGSFLADSSTNSFATTTAASTSPAWDYRSPFATGLGYKNRVYTWVNSGGAGTSATGTFTV